MAKKATIKTISSGYASNTQLNFNFAALNTKLDNTLSLDGSTPNSMGASLDMNGNDILNTGNFDVDTLTVDGATIGAAITAAAGNITTIFWEGAYAGGTAYTVNDGVSYNGSSYVCILNSTGNLPTNATYWEVFAAAGTDGADGADGADGDGSGDMLIATYDPNAVGGDAFAMDNMTEGTLTKVLTGVERSKLAGIETGATAGGGGIVYEERTTTHTAVSNTGYRADTSGAAWTLTLPASPADNDVIVVREQGGWLTNNLTIARNGNNIQGLAEDLTCDLDGVELSLVYDTSDTNWGVTTTNPSVANALSDVLTISAQTLTDAQKIQKRADFGVSAIPDAVIEDQKASGTDGGTFTSGAWQTRVLNTEVRDPDGLVSISSNQFTPTVAGWVEWTCPAFQTLEHVSRLYNVTDSVEVSLGSSEETVAGNQTRTMGGAAVVAGKAYIIEHRCTATKSPDGFGRGHSLGANVYTRLKFWRA